MKITIMGCGNMGKGLAPRLSEANQLFFYDRNFEKSQALEKEGLGKSCKELKDAIQSCAVLILAVKPMNVEEAAGQIAQYLHAGQTVISILAGTPIATLKKLFPATPIVRMMPNLAVIYGEGVMGVSVEEGIPEEQKRMLTSLLEPLGKIYWLPESKINALTALTGSGPAFFYTMLEAMIDAGVTMGFSADESQDMVQNMLQGSLTLLQKTGKHPGELKRQITSPGGTTIAGLNRLEEMGVRAGIINTFLACYERTNELSN